MGTVGLVALGMAAPASAADLAARPYTKAPPPILLSTTGPASTSAVTAAGDRAVIAWGFVPVAGAIIPDGCLISPEASSAASSATAGKRGQFVFGLEGQGDWADLNSSHVSIFNPAVYDWHQSRWHRPFHRPDRLCLECGAAVREGRRGGDEQPLS